MNQLGEKKWVLILASYFKGDSIAVIICVLGAILQSFHTYHIINYSSRIEDDTLRLIQSIGIGVFFSFSLLFWTLRAGSYNIAVPEHIKPRMKAMAYAHGLFLFEFLVNLHYWTREFIIIPIGDGTAFTDIGIKDMYDWSATVVISFALPWMIKTYAGQINLSKVGF